MWSSSSKRTPQSLHSAEARRKEGDNVSGDEAVPNLRSLLKKLQVLHRQYIDLEHEIADVERQITTAGNEPKPRAKRSTNAEIVEVIRATVKVLRDAGEPLPRREIASRLGITPWATAYRLQKAVKMKFVEKMAHGRYRCTGVIPL